MTLAALFLLIGGRGLHDAVANGDTRTLSFSHTHRDDQITVTFKRNGRYDDEALKRLNHFLRDWRTDDATRMDPLLFDILWEVSREVGAKQPIHIVSSYRAPKTNAMLSARSSGVARNSLHMQGKAIDYFIPGVALEELRIAGLRLQRGGVGYYPGSGSAFVHMDVGNVRHWPRMTRDQLVRVFPNGRTVHLPTDGNPLPGYALAKADIERRRSGGVLVADAGGSGTSLLQRLFSGGSDKDDDSAPAATASIERPAKPTVVAALDKTPAADKAAERIPLPLARPTIQLASAPLPPTRPAPVAPIPAPRATASLTPAQIIDLRGYWQGVPTVESPELRQLAMAARRARQPQRPAATLASRMADFESTASVAPWPREDGTPAEGALAYAPPPAAVARAEPMGAAVPRLPAAATPPDTTLAAKRTPGRVPVAAAPVRSSALAGKVGDHLNEPWLRALIVTPSARSFLNTTMYGVPDYQHLRSLMQKPAASVVMSFAGEAYAGLQSERFSGSAVVFQSTVAFGARTAALR